MQIYRCPRGKLHWIFKTWGKKFMYMYTTSFWYIYVLCTVLPHCIDVHCLGKTSTLVLLSVFLPACLFVCLTAYRSVIRLFVCLPVSLYVCSHKTKPLSSHLSSWVASPLMLTCSLRKNSWPFNFLRTSFDTNSQPFTDWMHDKLLSSLPEESWSSQTVGTSVLDVKCTPGLPGGVTAGESESWNKRREEHVTTLLQLWSIASHWPRVALWQGRLSIPCFVPTYLTSLHQCHAIQTIFCAKEFAP